MLKRCLMPNSIMLKSSSHSKLQAFTATFQSWLLINLVSDLMKFRVFAEGQHAVVIDPREGALTPDLLAFGFRCNAAFYGGHRVERVIPVNLLSPQKAYMLASPGYWNVQSGWFMTTIAYSSVFKSFEPNIGLLDRLRGSMLMDVRFCRWNLLPRLTRSPESVTSRSIACASMALLYCSGLKST